PGTWTHVELTLPPEAYPGERFGETLDMSGLDVLAPTVPDDTFGELSGAAYAIRLTPPLAFLGRGEALAGENGPPQLVPQGTLQPGKLVQLMLSDGKAGALGALIVGATQVNHPLQGGTLVPSPDLFLAMPTDALGSATLSGARPAGLPAGAILSMQWWTADAAGPEG